MQAQQAALGLPPLPTTTIGSFPQTADVRKARAAHQVGRLDDAALGVVSAGDLGSLMHFRESRRVGA